MRRKFSSRALQFIEPLERRWLLSTATTTTVSESTSASVMGQYVTFKALITPADQSSGTPTGTVTFMDGANTLGTANVNTNGKAHLDVFELFKGQHEITATYNPTGDFTATGSNTIELTVTRGNVNFRSSGLGVAEVTPGSGPGAAIKNYLEIDYSGYLSDGTQIGTTIGSSPYQFKLINPNGTGTLQVVEGVDKGLIGAQPGETLLIIVPPKLGYGAAGEGNVPGHSKLFFIIHFLNYLQPTLEVFSPNQTMLTSGAAASAANDTIFSNTVVGTETIMTFTAKGANADPLSEGDPFMTVTGANASDFILGAINSSNGMFNVTFFAQTGGLLKATINIFTNDPVNPDFKIKVQGNGD